MALVAASWRSSPSLAKLLACLLVVAAQPLCGSAASPAAALSAATAERRAAARGRGLAASGLLQTEVVPLDDSELEQVTPRRNLSEVSPGAASAQEGPHPREHGPLLLTEADAQNRAAAERAEGGSVLIGLLLLLLGLPIHWLNEERSARMDALICRGKEDCTSISANPPDPENRGKLVHVQGRTVSVLPVTDFQFQDAQLPGCLKLQSTVEVLNWVQTTHSWSHAGERRSQPRFHTEWTTSHQDSTRFRKPSPENPRPPSALVLGTCTTLAHIVEIGGFVIPQDMVNRFVSYEPAIARLPDTVSACGITFFANKQDGYYYARPSMSISTFSFHRPVANMLNDHQVGDLRVRFLYVPETAATVVAVQCEKGGMETFCPYRVVPRGPCITQAQERMKIIEEGDKSLKEVRGERLTACCGTTSGVATCCCCPCQTVTSCCMQEVVTEEIYYISDQLEPMEKPFQGVVHRNPLRVWNFRLIGMLITYGGVALLLRPLWEAVRTWPGLELYGSWAGVVLCLLVSLSCWAAVVMVSYACYRPFAALQWLVVATFFIAAPLVLGSSGHPHG